MSVFSIQNWRYGLDTRRSELTSQPGVLETAQNVHINQGAEVEKRKAFVNLGSFTNNVFGLEVAGASLVAFGSVSYGAVTVPSGVTYVQCAHPTDSTKSMTAVLCSCDFGGQAFCVAEFSDGNVFWFTANVVAGANNNVGAVIYSTIAGQVFTTIAGVQTLAQIAAQLRNSLTADPFYTAGWLIGGVTSTGFNLIAPYGTTWSPVVSVNSTNSGQITTALLSTGEAPVAAGTGAGALTLYAGTTGSLATLVDVASSSYNLITSAVAFTTNVAGTAGAIVSAINSQGTTANPTLGLSAAQIANSVAISTTAAIGSNFLKLSLSTGSNLCFENMAFDFSGITTVPTVKNIYTTNGTNSVPGTAKYGTEGSIYGSTTGTSPLGAAFTLSYGTYLWIPGANDTKLTVNTNQVYLAVDYPQGVVVTWSTDYFHMQGKDNLSVTAQVFQMTDILNNAGITLSNLPTAAQITSIAAAITAKSSTTNFVASNTGVSGVPGLVMWISRKTVSINATSYSGLYFYANIAGISPANITAITSPAQFGIGQSTPAVVGSGTTYSITFSGTWNAGDTFTFQIVTPALTYDVGIGRLYGLIPSACMTLNNRVHVIAGSNWLGSDNGDATQWEQQAPGAFSIDVSQNFRQADSLISLAAYQGRIALFANYVTLIWALDANPNNITQTQALANIGTFSPLGPQSLGDLDVVFPCVTGFRSLRVRDLSLNAYVNDLGSPVDLLVQADINTVGLGNLGTTCGIVEPSANRYWLYINGKIYVLSYFPSAKINSAWSVYTPTTITAGVTLTFVPLKFVIYNSQVYLLANIGGSNYLLIFGGANNTTYDATIATVATPWLDFGSPGVRKQFRAVDFAMTNAWQFATSADYYGYINNAGTLDQVITVARSNVSFQLGSFGIIAEGFHFKIQGQTSVAAYAVLSALDIHYEKQDEK